MQHRLFVPSPTLAPIPARGKRLPPDHVRARRDRRAHGEPRTREMQQYFAQRRFVAKGTKGLSGANFEWNRTLIVMSAIPEIGRVR